MRIINDTQSINLKMIFAASVQPFCQQRIQLNSVVGGLLSENKGGGDCTSSNSSKLICFLVVEGR